MLEFNIPNILPRESGNIGKFIIEPLERGYGTTLGNSLRRVMLSSLPGAAVAFIKIDGILHEFSTVPGVTEDVTEIVLNVKGIVVKMTGNVIRNGYVEFVGPGVVTAGDIKTDAEVEIINPEHVLATVEKGARFYMELGFVAGRGYTSADKNRRIYNRNTTGVIYTDSIFTPILKVNYEVEDTRVGSQTDFDRLTVEVRTNGSISPTDAMAVASNIIIKHFECISAISGTAVKPEMIPDEETQLTAMLDMTVEDMEFSARSFNCLKRAGIDTVSDLIAKTAEDMMKIRNLGKKSYDEIKEKLNRMGLDFLEVE